MLKNPPSNALPFDNTLSLVQKIELATTMLIDLNSQFENELNRLTGLLKQENFHEVSEFLGQYCPIIETEKTLLVNNCPEVDLDNCRQASRKTARINFNDQVLRFEANLAKAASLAQECSTKSLAMLMNARNAPKSADEKAPATSAHASGDREVLHAPPSFDKDDLFTNAVNKLDVAPDNASAEVQANYNRCQTQLSDLATELKAIKKNGKVPVAELLSMIDAIQLKMLYPKDDKTDQIFVAASSKCQAGPSLEMKILGTLLIALGIALLVGTGLACVAPVTVTSVIQGGAFFIASDLSFIAAHRFFTHKSSPELKNKVTALKACVENEPAPAAAI